MDGHKKNKKLVPKESEYFLVYKLSLFHGFFLSVSCLYFMVDFKTKQNSVIVYFSAESLLVIQKNLTVHLLEESTI